MPLKTTPPEEPTLNLTPMIDVILTLVIFFMVGSRFAEEENALGVKVPTVSSRAAGASAPEPKVVNVFPDGSVFLGTKPVSLDELTAQLEAARSDHRKVECARARRQRRDPWPHDRGLRRLPPRRRKRSGHFGASAAGEALSEPLLRSSDFASRLND